MNSAIVAALSVVGKALSPVADGLLEAWAASKDLASNFEELKTELLSVRAMLETAQGRQLDGEAQKELLNTLRHSASKAEDILDELDYFRIHDKLHGTNDAADEHPKGGCAHNLVFNLRHTAKAVSNRLAPSCAAGHGGSSSSSTTNTNQAVDKGSGCMHNLGKLFLCSSSPPVEADDVVDSLNSTLNATKMHKATQKNPTKLGFDRVDISSRMKETVKELQTIHKHFSKVVQNSSTKIPTNIARPTTVSESVEPKLYGRAREVEGIIHDITKGKYCEENLTVLPIVGPGGIGKTTMTQHICHNQQVQKHFDVVIWVCVSQNFNLNNLLEEIKGSIPQVDGEKREGRAKELIEHRLKSKRFLLILDDMWEPIGEDVWKNLLLPLKKSEQKGSVILVTTRFPSLAQMVKTTENPTVLEGLKHEEFKELFLAYVFCDNQSEKHHPELLATGQKIMEKLKGSPLAAKTVGRLLRNNLNLLQWEEVLESKEWETQNEDSDIMPALRLSYDYLPFQLQQCFFYCGLFPEDYKFHSKELIWFWIGLGILHAGPDFEEIGMSSLNGLVTHGFLKKEETNGHVHYIMHDLLHDLALMVSSHECLSVHGSVRSVGIQPCIRHLSIITDGVDCELFKNELRKLKDTLKVEDLQTLMFFGSIGNSFTDIFVDFFSEAKSFRVLRLPRVPDSVESVVPKFSELLHLRYLSLGTYYNFRRHLPDCISRFYHLRILDLKGWEGCRDLPRDITNLGKLCHFLGPSENLNSPTDNLHSSICDVGKLKLLRELKAFIVNKEDQGYEPEQLAHLTEVTELRIYYLEKIHEKEEAAKAKLLEKKYLERLALVWYGDGDNTITDRQEGQEKVLEGLQPHRHLQQLYIHGHRGRSCPKWLGDELAVPTLNHLHLCYVSWEITPSLGNMPDLRELIFEYMAGIVEFRLERTFSKLTRLELVCLERLKKWVAEGSHLFGHLQELIIKDCPALLELPFSDQQDSNKHRFPLLQKLEIVNCPEVLSLPPIPWTETLCSVLIKKSKLLCKLILSECTLELITSGRGDVHCLDQILVFENLGELESLTLVNLHDICPPYCPPLQWKHLQLLKSLKKFVGEVSFGTTVVPTGCQGDVHWQLPIEDINMIYSGASGEEMTWLLHHLPKLSQLKIGEHITQLVFQQTITPLPEEVEAVESLTKKGKEEEKVGPLVLPAHLSESLEKLEISAWKLSKPMWLVIYPLHELQTLRILLVKGASRCKVAGFSSWCCPFPSSLQELMLEDVLGLDNLEPLSNLSSLRKLQLIGCGKHLRCEGLAHLLTRGQLSELQVNASIVSESELHSSPTFFVGWDPRQELHLENGDELPSSKLQILKTEGIAGVLTAPICSFLSSSLTHLFFYGEEDADYFTEEQEKALQLLTSLEELYFSGCRRFPEGLNKLTKLKTLEIFRCQFMESMPIDGLPSSLRELDVKRCYSEKLTRQCSKLKGTIPILRLDSSLDGFFFGN